MVAVLGLPGASAGASPVGSTIAGVGIAGYGGDGGPARLAPLDRPRAVIVDGRDLLVADTHNDRVRRISPTGTITTVAGTGRSQDTGDGGPATRAGVHGPRSLALGADGTLFIAEPDRIRAVSPGGVIETVDVAPTDRPSLRDVRAIASGTDGSLAVAEGAAHRVSRLAPDGTLSVIAGDGRPGTPISGAAASRSALVSPSGVWVQPDGTVLVADAGNAAVYAIDTAGVISTVAGGGQALPQAGIDARIMRLLRPVAVVGDGTGFAVVDSDAGVVLRVTPEGTVNRVYGDVGSCLGVLDPLPLSRLTFCHPGGVALAPAGGLLIADTAASVVRYIGSPAAAAAYPTAAPLARIMMARLCGRILEVEVLAARRIEAGIEIGRGTQVHRLARRWLHQGRQRLSIGLPAGLRGSHDRVRLRLTGAPGRSPAPRPITLR